MRSLSLSLFDSRMSSITVLLVFFGILNCFVNGKRVQTKPSNNADDIPLKYLKACGVPIPTLIDIRYFRCHNGLTVPITTSSTPSTTTSPVTIPRKPPTPPESNGICRIADQLLCNGTPLCGAELGYQCCGFELYHPDFQTCCQISSAKYRINYDKPEKEHVCCHLNAYKRGSENLPCEHASSNDKFSRNLTNLKVLKQERTRCVMDTQDILFVYKIDITDRSIHKTTRPELHGTISMWPLRGKSTPRARINPKTPSQTKSTDIPLDIYSPVKKNLVGKSYFTITTKDYLDKAVFYLNPSDNLYQWPKNSKRQRRVVKILNKIKRRCNKQKSKSRKRSRSSHKF